jgi:DNA-binding NtrC family response regulator
MEAGEGEHGVQGLPLSWSLDEVEKHHMLRVLESSAGNKSRAARSLGVSRKTLERKLKSWNET